MKATVEITGTMLNGEPLRAYAECEDREHADGFVDDFLRVMDEHIDHAAVTVTIADGTPAEIQRCVYCGAADNYRCCEFGRDKR